MNRVLYKEQLSETVFLMRLEAPLIAQERQPGQFIILQVYEDFGERIPLTIADADTAEGSITIVYQTVGRTTELLAELEVGQSVEALVGPLGAPTQIEKLGSVVCVGGGIGIAPLHPIAKALKAAGNHVTIILGARTKELLILEKKMAAIADELIVCTDDGSYGRKGLVTDPLMEICGQDTKPDLAVVIGPPVMMKFCSAATQPVDVPTVVSLNAIMVDGTGMCGGCRVTVGNETKFVCVDGPEFNGHEVDFENLINRLSAYKQQEKNHICRLEQAR
ncbi:MAG: sulfide/dihydroorotate dehydrogenase-like FAD/NAD-binding protein [Pontiella sp.]